MPSVSPPDTATKPLVPSLSSDSLPRGSRGGDRAAIKPLDVETTGVDSSGLTALDRRIDRALLPCLCMISVANYLGEWFPGW